MVAGRLHNRRNGLLLTARARRAEERAEGAEEVEGAAAAAAAGEGGEEGVEGAVVVAVVVMLRLLRAPPPSVMRRRGLWDSRARGLQEEEGAAGAEEDSSVGAEGLAVAAVVAVAVAVGVLDDRVEADCRPHHHMHHMGTKLWRMAGSRARAASSARSRWTPGSAGRRRGAASTARRARSASCASACWSRTWAGVWDCLFIYFFYLMASVSPLNLDSHFIFYNSPVCKAPLENIFVFDSPQDARPYAALHIWGTEAGPGVVYDDRAAVRGLTGLKDVGMWGWRLARGLTISCRTHRNSYSCPKASTRRCSSPSKRRAAPSSAAACSAAPSPRSRTTCGHRTRSGGSATSAWSTRRSVGSFDGRPMVGVQPVELMDSFPSLLLSLQVFVGEQLLYSKGELQRHVEKGEPSQGFLGHPVRPSVLHSLDQVDKGLFE